MPPLPPEEQAAFCRVIAGFATVQPGPLSILPLLLTRFSPLVNLPRLLTQRRACCALPTGLPTWHRYVINVLPWFCQCDAMRCCTDTCAPLPMWRRRVSRVLLRKRKLCLGHSIVSCVSFQWEMERLFFFCRKVSCIIPCSRKLNSSCQWKRSSCRWLFRR